ncbi:MAG: NAD(+)--rifampin ADP-ribosyltransferase [Chitinophagaceae bacterium]|nr:MAG: NAD(+)--rifampin ADP-ribosyltransferase [Chitinophagaceae bacterium]
MEFSPNNKVVRLCLQGMGMEEIGKPAEAASLFLQAWNEATNDFETFLAAHYVARQQATASDRLHWLNIALQSAQNVNDNTVMSAFPNLYRGIASCYEDLQDPARAKEFAELARDYQYHPADSGPFYHGTKADLPVGALLTPGGNSNYQAELRMNHIYFTALVNGAGLAAELAKGSGAPRVYRVEPTGSFENDPNVTDKKFPGNPTRSYRSADPLKIVGVVTDWVRLTPQELQGWKDRLANSSGEIIN